MSNEWRTLKEIYEEGHKLPIRIDGACVKNHTHHIAGVNTNGEILVQMDSGIPNTNYIQHGWRIYEEPKQPKKWAPALLVDCNGVPLQPERWYSSLEEATDLLAAGSAKVIWPAPGFTPVEIPE